MRGGMTVASHRRPPCPLARLRAEAEVWRRLAAYNAAALAAMKEKS